MVTYLTIQLQNSLSVPKALRCLRGRKRVEKRADNLFAKLESIRAILDKIAQSQTDKMVS